MMKLWQAIERHHEALGVCLYVLPALFGGVALLGVAEALMRWI